LEELSELDAKGLPDPISADQKKIIMDRAHDSYHQPVVACSVCNQFCSLSATELLLPCELPPAVFTVLQPSPEAEPLSAEVLAQYDISRAFLDVKLPSPSGPPAVSAAPEVSFSSALLSFEGVVYDSHEADFAQDGDGDLPEACSDGSCACPPRIRVCNECLSSLKAGNRPTKSIANGNFWGWGPPECDDMSYASRVLIRPVQQFGQLTVFDSEQIPHGGTRMTGHQHSTRLDVPLVSKTLPISASSAPTRAVVVSGFASKRFKIRQADLAKAKDKFIVQPDKMRAMLNFWVAHNPKIMKILELDDEDMELAFAQLPDGDVAPEMFVADCDHEDSKDKDFKDDESDPPPAGSSDLDGKPLLQSGGPDLLQSHESLQEAIPTSATVCVGGDEHDSHAQVARVIDNTYVVSASQTFVSDSDPDYLETRYPDKLCHGRGGFGEFRKPPISRAGVLALMCNSASRQFQSTDFVLPTTDCVLRTNAAKAVFVKAKLPSHVLAAPGVAQTRAEAYGKVPTEDMLKVAAYKKECAEATDKGIPLPDPPASLSGLGQAFFTDMDCITQDNPFSRAANLLYRREVYAAHNNMGKSHWWITVSPPDHECRRILFYALAPEQFKPLESQAPDAAFRFKVLADNPVAAALNFERVLNVLIEDILGWDLGRKAPRRGGGLFGIPKAWLRVVEEQGRLTLHTHLLLWVYGHTELTQQMKAALAKDLSAALFAAFGDNVVSMEEEAPHAHEELTSAFLCPSCVQETLQVVGALGETPESTQLCCTSCQCTRTAQEQLDPLLSSLADPASVHAVRGPPDPSLPPSHPPEKEASGSPIPSLPACLHSCASGGPCIQGVLDRLTANIDACVTGELVLPAQEMALAEKCPACANGILVAVDEPDLKKMRNRPGHSQAEPHSLKCSTCSHLCTASSRIKVAFETGYHRVRSRGIPTAEDRLALVWEGLPKRPSVDDADALDAWLLDVAFLQDALNMHDWRHRTSCFKGGKDYCRYKSPQNAVESSRVAPVFATLAGPTGTRVDTTDLVGLDIDIRKRAAYMFLTDCSVDLLSIFHCNNCVKYVVDQKVSLYYGCYTTKHNSQNAKAVAKMFLTMQRYEAKLAQQAQEASESGQPQRSARSVGLGRMLSAARGATAGETVGAPLVSFVARGNKIFAMSHKTVVLPLPQAKAYLLGEPIHASVSANGTVIATSHDYVFRNDSTEDQHMWTFVAGQETSKFESKSVQVAAGKDDDVDGDSQPAPPSGNSVGSTDPEGLPFFEPSAGSAKREILPFSPNADCYHPRCDTHGHRPRTRPCWVRYLGKRLPDLLDLQGDSKLDTEERDCRREQYAQGVLIMFRPFRSLQDLLNDGETWWQAYERQLPAIQQDKAAYAVIRNMQNYYESFCRPDSARFESVNGEDPHEIIKGILEQEDRDAIDVHDDMDPANLEAEQEDAGATSFLQMLNRCPAKTLDLTPAPGSAFTSVSLQDARSAKARLPKHSKKGEFQLARAADVEPMRSWGRSPDGGTSVELLEQLKASLEDTKFEKVLVEVDVPEVLPVTFPTIGEQSRHWCLNELQHLSFVLMAAALFEFAVRCHCDGKSMLDKLGEAVVLLLSRILPLSGRLVLFLTGPAGAGKSRVSLCFEDLARRWQLSPAVVITATSGVAAMLIGGSTIHSALGVGLSLNPPGPTPAQGRAWSGIGFVLLDEFSMCAPPFFDLVDSRMSLLKGCNLPFGGLHLALTGCFFQLPPPKVAPIFRLPTEIELGLDEAALASDHGRQLWRTCLTDFCELVEVKRQKDPAWAAVLERFKLNQPTAADLKLVNSRYIGFAAPPPPPGTPLVSGGPGGFLSSPLPPPGTPAAVCTNASREGGVKFAIKEFIRSIPAVQLRDTDWRARRVLLIQADITKTRGAQPIPERLERTIRDNLSAKQLGVFGNLFMVLGAKYINTSNDDVSNKLSNGTMGVLTSIVLLPQARIRMVALDSLETLTVHAVYASEVEQLVFMHAVKDFQQVKAFPSLGPGQFPVCAVTSTRKFNVGASKPISARVTQFQVGLACVMTGHKLQGQSLEQIILGDLSAMHKYGTTGWLYVVLSRAKTLEGLYTLVLLDPDPANYKLRADVLQEMRRLRLFGAATLARVRAAIAGSSFSKDGPDEPPNFKIPLLPPSKGGVPRAPAPSSLMGQCRWTLESPPAAMDAKTQFERKHFKALCRISRKHVVDRTAFCGPVWASLGHRNSCSVDTLLFCLFVWYAVLANPVDMRPGASPLEKAYLTRFLQSMSVLRDMLDAGRDAYVAWACCKHLFWQWLYGLNDMYQAHHGEALDWVRFDLRDNLMNMWDIIDPILPAFGRHTLTFERRCPDCKGTTTFDHEYSTHPFLVSLLRLQQPQGPAFQCPAMSTLILESLGKQCETGNDTCPHCFSQQLGSQSDLGFVRNPADSIIGAEVTATTGQFCVRFVPGWHRPAGYDVATPVIGSELTLCGRKMYLHTIVMRPRANHFNCFVSLPDTQADLAAGWYKYDGLGGYLTANSRWTKQANALRLSAPPKRLAMNELLALCYGPTPVPEFCVDTCLTYHA